MEIDSIHTHRFTQQTLIPMKPHSMTNLNEKGRNYNIFNVEFRSESRKLCFESQLVEKCIDYSNGQRHRLLISNESLH